MDAFERVDQAADVAAIRDKLRQMRNSATVIVAKTAELVEVRSRWIALVAEGAYDQVDVDALNALQMPVASLNSASAAFIAATQ